MLDKPFSPKSLVSRMASMDCTLYGWLREKVADQTPYIMSAISQRAKTLTAQDAERCDGYMNLNMFPNLTPEEQMACYSMVLDAEHLRELNKHMQQNQGYHGDEPIFINTPLYESVHYDNELVDYDAVHRQPETNISRVGNRFVRLDSRIPMCFYHWLEDCFSESEKAVRIDPSVIYDTMPPQMILECLIQPPKRDWWNTLNIYNGESKGCSFMLLGNDVNNIQDYQDYNVLGIRKLQVSVTRQNHQVRNAGNMQMMIEELTKIYEASDPSKSYMIGRMIHLDTDAMTGTSFKDATLNHIDLAENLYVGDAAYARDNQDLAIDHRIEDAKPRTHLLRVNNIPFESIFKFAYAFFKSKQLVDEWKDAEFA